MKTAEELINARRRWSSMPRADEFMVERLARLLRWREYVPAIAKAAGDVLGEDVKVYVVGGAAEGRLTAASDIDVVIITSKALQSARDRSG